MAVKFGNTFKRNFSFIMFGTIAYAVWSMVMSTAQDVLAATSLPTTVVLIAQSTPYALIGIICPYFIQKFSYWGKVIAITTVFIIGLILLSLVDHVGWKLFGIVLLSTGSGLGEITFIPLTAMYDESAVGAYFTGSGLGFVIAPFYYTGLTIFACVPPPTTLAFTIVLPLFLPLLYHMVNKSESEMVAMTMEHKEVPYSPLVSAQSQDKNEFPVSEKLSVIRQWLVQFLSLFIGMFCEYLTLQAVITTLAFPNAPFDPRDHYVIYTLLLFFGELIGRSYGLLLSCIKPDIKPYTKHTWVLTVLETTILVFFVLASWYRFLPSIWIVLLLAFLAGVIIGALYVNAIAVTGENETSLIKREFARAFVQGGAILGIFVASLVGLTTESILRQHCMSVASDTDLCLTRNMKGWNASASCYGL